MLVYTILWQIGSLNKLESLWLTIAHGATLFANCPGQSALAAVLSVRASGFWTGFAPSNNEPSNPSQHRREIGQLARKIGSV